MLLKFFMLVHLLMLKMQLLLLQLLLLQLLLFQLHAVASLVAAPKLRLNVPQLLLNILLAVFAAAQFFPDVS